MAQQSNDSLKSRRAGRLATSKAKCVLALEVQLGGQSCVGAEKCIMVEELEEVLDGYGQGGAGGGGVGGTMDH